MAKRILIADDSVTIQKAFAMTFAGADDVTVSGARSADEGLALAQRTHPARHHAVGDDQVRVRALGQRESLVGGART